MRSLILLLLLSISASAQVTGWLNGDVGTPSAAGSASGSSTITINDAGAQFYDRFNSSGHLVYNWTRDEGASKYVTARVTSQASSDDYAQACVGFWAGRNQNSRFAAACLNKNKSISFYVRYIPNGRSAEIAAVPILTSQPYLRAKRVLDSQGGYTVTAEYSADGSSWTVLGSARIPRLPTICQVGIGSAAHDTTLRAATFTNLASDYATISNVFFISTTASGGTGTEDAPYTLDEGWRTQTGSIPAGSVVFLRGGVYRAKLTVNLSGASGNPTEIRAYPDEYPVINGTVQKRLLTAITAATGPNSCGFTLDNGDYLQSAVKLTANNEDIRITNCTFGCTVIGNAVPTGCVRGDNGTTPSTYPVGQIIGIWGPVITLAGSYLNIYDLEITQDYTNRVNVDGRYAGVAQNEDQQWPSYLGPGILNTGNFNNLYGIYNHDNADGYNSFISTGGDIDSAISMNNGGGGVSRCNGPGIYTQNPSATVTRTVKRLLSFNNFSAAVKIGGVAGPVLNYVLDQSIGQNGGAQCLRGTWATTGQGLMTLDFVSDGLPIQNVTATNSVFWGNPKSSSQVVFFGYVNANNDNGTFQNNYILNGNRLLLSQNWQRLNLSNNFFYATNTPQSPELVNSKWTTYGPFSGKATLTGTTLTRTSGDNFQPTSWASPICVEGCQNQLSLTGGSCGNGNYVVVAGSVSMNGQTLQLTQGVAGTCTNLTFTVAQVQSHPITGSYTFNNNVYWNNLASNDFGSTPASSDSATYIYAWSRNARPAAIANVFHATSGICSGGSTLTAPPNFSGATDCSWRGWSGNDATSVFNTGKPTSAANFTQFNKLLDGLNFGWRAFIWAQDWSDTGLVTLTAANLGTIMQSGDEFEVRKGENPGAVVYSGTYAGSTVTFNVSNTSVQPATAWSYVLRSTWPRGGALILIVK